jgi:hypothetical protein
MKTDQKLAWCRAEDLPGQRYPLPEGWDPYATCAVFFVLSANGPALYPFVKVGDIAGVPVPHGPRDEFPMGCYVLADLGGRVEFVGPWGAEMMAFMRDHIDQLRDEANLTYASPDDAPLARVLH